MKYKILTLFVITLTVDEKHYLLSRDNLTQTIHIQLSQKQKTFFQFFLAFLKSILNFKHFPKKDDPHRWWLSGNTSSEKYGEINVLKAAFQRTLRQTTSQTGGNTVAGPLQYLLINVKVVSSQKVFHWCTKSEGCLLRHWQSTRSIISLLETI